MRIITISVDRLNPAPYNPRVELKPGDPEYEKLKRSLDTFGLVEPLVWNRRSGHLVGGHQRLRVLIDQGVTEVDVSVVDLSPERERALNIALNKIAGAWDQDKLAALLDELTKVPEFDVGLTGFDVPEIDAILAGALAGTAKPEAFDLDAELEWARAHPPVTKPGDLITLGTNPRTQHRLLCGDCTDHEQVRHLMDGTRAGLFATDPPYLVGYDGTNHPGNLKSKARASLNKDWSGSYCSDAGGTTWDDPESNPELYDKFVAAAIAEAIIPNAAFYCWHASKRQSLVEAAWTKHGVLLHQQIIWAKTRPVLNRSWYTWQHEPCLFGWLKGNKPERVERAVLSTVWTIDGISREDRPDHPTPKPLELFEIPMRQHTRAGEVCYEPFAGSGTQLIAAQRTGRRCFALELSPIYCDVIVRRFIAYAGESSVTPELARRYRIDPSPKAKKAASATRAKPTTAGARP